MRRTPSVVTGNNADLFAAIAPLYLPPDVLVLDVTFGKGNFWAKYRPPRLVAHDLAVDGVDFRQLPEADRSVDVWVFDPPWMSTGNQATSTIPAFYEAYGLGGLKGWRQCFELMAAGMKEGTRVVRRRGLLLVKCGDFVESGAKRWGHDHVVDTARSLGLVRADEFVLVSGTGAQPTHNLDGSPRRWHHSHRAHSFLCVFRVP